MRHPFKFLSTLSLLSLLFLLNNQSINAQTEAKSTYTVKLIPAENGSYTIDPQIKDGEKVQAGTVLTISTTPDPEFSLDAIYYTFEGGMWGTKNMESFSSPTKITVDKDLSLGATFIDKSLVENLNETQDVVYAKPGLKPLKYDVFAPKNAKNLPCIVIIHGGGWSSNNEDVMRGLARELTKGDKYVVFSIDYRWVKQLDGDEQPNSMHQLIEDVFGAIAHIQEHAAEYGGDPSNIAVTGDSAGGHLAEAAALLSPQIGDGGFNDSTAVYQFKPTYIPEGKSIEEVQTEITESIKAVAPSYAPTDARDFKMFISQTSDSYYDAVSPNKHIPNVKERSIPHFMTRGTKDFVVSDKVVQTYVDELEAAGQRVEYHKVEGAEHAFYDWKPDAKTRATFAEFGEKYAAEMQKFFDSVFYK